MGAGHPPAHGAGRHQPSPGHAVGGAYRRGCQPVASRAGRLPMPTPTPRRPQRSDPRAPAPPGCRGRHGDRRREDVGCRPSPDRPPRGGPARRRPQAGAVLRARRRPRRPRCGRTRRSHRRAPRGGLPPAPLVRGPDGAPDGGRSGWVARPSPSRTSCRSCAGRRTDRMPCRSRTNGCRRRRTGRDGGRHPFAAGGRRRLPRPVRGAGPRRRRVGRRRGTGNDQCGAAHARSPAPLSPR